VLPELIRSLCIVGERDEEDRDCNFLDTVTDTDLQHIQGINRAANQITSKMNFKHPFTAIIAGPSGSGKTVFTRKLIEHASRIIDPPPQRIVWCYGIYQTFFNEMKNVEFVEGVPDVNLFDGRQRTLLILDDLMHETDDRVSQIFTRVSHHKSLSVLYLTQNLFYKTKQNRTMSLNAHYLVLFKNPRDMTQVSHLAAQMYPGKSKYMIESYRDATSIPFSYLLVDLKSDTEEKMRLRSNIFPGETTYVYVSK